MKEPKVRNRWFNTATINRPQVWDDQAKQEFKEECDINRILQRYDQVRPGPFAPVPRFGDFAEAPEDFLAAQLLVKRAEEEFHSLPALVRERFNHSPVRLLEFLRDPANVDEARKLGLVNPAPVPPAPTPPTDTKS